MGDLFSQLVTWKNLESGWKRVRDNHGCHGVDGISIEQFQSQLRDNLTFLSRELILETYRPLPLMRILVDKGNGESRALSIPAVRDRIAQAASLNILEPQGIRLVRYADDFLVLCKTREKAQEASELTDEILERMSLRLDEADIVHFDQGFRFLGVTFCRSVVMVPFEAEKKQKRVLYMPPLMPLSAYYQGLLSTR